MMETMHPAAWLVVLALAQSPAPDVKARLEHAAGEAKAGKLEPALSEVDGILREAPENLRALLLRAKILYKLGQLDEADRAASAVLAKRPGVVPAKQLVEKIRNEQLQRQMAKPVKAKPTVYAPEERVWTLAPETKFNPIDYKGPDGLTLFVAPSATPEDDYLESYRRDATGARAFYLRVVDLRGKNGKPDAGVAAARSLGLKAGDKLPYYLVMDAAGTELARGTASAADNALAKVRFRKVLAAASGPVATLDFATAECEIESAAFENALTVVVLTSPACGACIWMKDRIEAIPAGKPGARVVFADIGETEDKKINTGAPVFKKYDAKGTPWFFVVDESGKLVAQGEDAKKMVEPWLGAGP
jgi:tetratricopeptide (TPR) repeat protein